MNKPRKNGYGSPPHGEPSGNEAEQHRLPQREANPTSGLEAALDSGLVDLKPVVRFLASRLWDAEHRLAQLGRCMDGMKRRIGELESQLARMASRSSEHEESLRMMCAVLKDLDDPYGFGLSLDDRLAYDGGDRTAEEDE